MIARDRVAAIWALLMTATLVSWLLGGDHVIHGRDAVGAVVIVIAFVKVRLVGLHFMELRGAPRPLRGVFEAYVGLACAVLLGLFLAY